MIRQVITSVDHGIPNFVPWYRSEHQNRKCKWQQVLMAFVSVYFEETKFPLTPIGRGKNRLSAGPG